MASSLFLAENTLQQVQQWILLLELLHIEGKASIMLLPPVGPAESQPKAQQTLHLGLVE